MLQTVKDACKFDPKAIDYALSDQIENLDDLIGHDYLKSWLRERRTVDIDHEGFDWTSAGLSAPGRAAMVFVAFE